MICTKCNIEPVSSKRWNLGTRVCLTCGEILAKEEIARKSKRIAPAYNKGGLMYMGDESVAKQNLIDSSTCVGQGRTVHFDVFQNPTVVVQVQKSTTVKKYPKPLGFFIPQGSLEKQAFFDKNDSRLQKAKRVVFFNGETL